MVVLSHKVAQVVDILGSDNSSVQKGATVLKLDTINEDLWLARLASLERLRSILALRLADPTLKINRQIAQIAADTAASLESLASKQYQLDLDTLHQGNPQIGQPAQASDAVAALTSPFQTKKANIQLELFDLQLDESKAINQLVQNHLQAEVQAATVLKTRATFTALVAGKIRLRVAKGAFVKKGEILFEIV